jgi:hypothetical protein
MTDAQTIANAIATAGEKIVDQLVNVVGSLEQIYYHLETIADALHVEPIDLVDRPDDDHTVHSDPNTGDAGSQPASPASPATASEPP